MGNRTEFIGLDLYYSQEFVDDLQNNYIEEIESWKRVATKNFNEAEDYKSIIKEVREYIESYNLPKDLGHLGEAPISIRELRDILEILDKGSDEISK